MILVPDRDGNTVYIAAASVSRITQAGAASQWHGVKCHIRTVEGDVIECRRTAEEVAEAVAKQLERS